MWSLLSRTVVICLTIGISVPGINVVHSPLTSLLSERRRNVGQSLSLTVPQVPFNEHSCLLSAYVCVWSVRMPPNDPSKVLGNRTREAPGVSSNLSNFSFHNWHSHSSSWEFTLILRKLHDLRTAVPEVHDSLEGPEFFVSCNKRLNAIQVCCYEIFHVQLGVRDH